MDKSVLITKISLIAFLSIFLSACGLINTEQAQEVLDIKMQVLEMQIELPPVSNLFNKGHRIRLDISSSNFPRFDVNPNTGEAIGRHTYSRVAVNTVYSDAAHPSHVVLPVVGDV